MCDSDCMITEKIVKGDQKCRVLCEELSTSVVQLCSGHGVLRRDAQVLQRRYGVVATVCCAMTLKSCSVGMAALRAASLTRFIFFFFCVI